MVEQSLNLHGDYIFRRIQKDHTDNRITRCRARESLSGLYISSKDIQEWNDIEDVSKIFPGQVLKLFL